MRVFVPFLLSFCGHHAVLRGNAKDVWRRHGRVSMGVALRCHTGICERLYSETGGNL